MGFRELHDHSMVCEFCGVGDRLDLHVFSNSDGRERGERRVPEGLEGDTRVDAEGDDFVGVRSRAKKGSFGVESKWFDVEVREQKDKVQALIVERKGGVSSWIRLGPNSIGCFIDGLEACIENAGTGTWERKWKDSGREESLPKKGATLLRSSMGKTYVEAAVQSKEKETAVVRVELCKRELSRNMGKLVHCLVGSWDPSSGKGDDLRGWGTKLAKFWSLKGNLGIAKLERGKALLEFEVLAEAEKALKIGGFSWAGSPLSLEKWRPERGCLPEGEKRSEAWVRILGLPVSLWERDILRRIGDACGGFLDTDSQTETLEDLQWARILVKLNKERPPNVVEVRTEEFCYELTLWWEIRPAVRMARKRKGKSILVSEGKVGGEVSARARGRVRGLVGGPSLEVRLQSDDGTRGQSSGLGLRIRIRVLVLDGPHESCGLATQWALGPSEASGPFPPTAYPCESGPSHLGLSLDVGRASKKLIGGAGLGAQALRGGLDQSWSFLLVTAGLWRPSAEEQSLEENSKTDDALMEEALRYGNASNFLWAVGVCFSFSPFFFFWSDSIGGVLRPFWGGSGRIPEGIYGSEDDWKDACMERISVLLVRRFQKSGIGGRPARRKKKKGKSAQQVSLRNSKFERELKRLECSINYDGEGSRKALCKEEGASLQLFYEVKVGGGEESGLWEVPRLGGYGSLRLSGWLKNVEDGVVWIFTGVYGPCNRKEREELWEELGAIRGIWEEPWCFGGDFNVTLSQRDRSKQGNLNGAMRRFAQVVDDLALIDLPLQGGVYSWSGGRSNQTWARLDRFLVSQDWLDIFRGVVQCRLPRPTSDHFPILLKGGGMSRGPSPFRFENMWLKVDGFKELLREWWQEGERVGRASFRMAAKMKEMKEKIKEVRKEIVKAFQHQLREEPGWRADLKGLHLKSLDLSEAEALEEEIVELFKEFYDQKSFAKSLNATFLVIIPKKGGAEDLGEFRPISLLGGLYKLMAKVLANRLKMVLDKVVSADQNAFVRRRQILDASLIANEVVDYRQKRKEKGLVCKLDIEKAYDSISWSFLMKVLKKMGFGSRWMDWMWWCFSTTKFSVLINGVPVGFFSSSKGLREGDPISPYLFILGMEVLSALIRWAVQGNFISGCRLRAASGLRINLTKSELIPVGEIDNIEEMAVELGCRIGSFPVKYLGLPLGARHKALSTWDGVEERMRRRLTVGKDNTCLRAGESP
ncbi:LINE-1 reverse transcriptase-like [Vitis vinifera]|uniref:LINE-1 reverse transcriptase-like n=1 Tax=Vitis vinifera TaxID=29760 RepID=A0A438ESP9_VITVI|nr:LINE-1 reverse transcriptase-like [Vitis vinifera]